MNIDDFFESDQCNRFLEDFQGHYANQEKGQESKSLSKRIKELRLIQGFSLERLAEISKIETNTLLKIENQEIFPDLGTVLKLSKALRITTSLLLGEESGYSYSVVRKADRQKTKRFVSGTRERTDNEYRSLACGIKNKHMDSFIVTLGSKTSKHDLSSHDGEEFILVLKGSIRVVLAQKEEILKEGDTIYYLSSIPHNVLPYPDGEKAEILAVIYTANH